MLYADPPVSILSIAKAVKFWLMAIKNNINKEKDQDVHTKKETKLVEKKEKVVEKKKKKIDEKKESVEKKKKCWEKRKEGTGSRWFKPFHVAYESQTVPSNWKVRNHKNQVRN